MQSFFEYLDRPSPETYEAVRRDVQSDPDFDLLSTALSDLERLVANEDFQAAVDILPQAVPTWLLSPRFHRLAGTAAHNVGNRELALWRPARCRLCYLIANKPPYEIVGWLHGVRFDRLPAETRSFIADYVEPRRVRGRELAETAR